MGVGRWSNTLAEFLNSPQCSAGATVQGGTGVFGDCAIVISDWDDFKRASIQSLVIELLVSLLAVAYISA